MARRPNELRQQTFTLVLASFSVGFALNALVPSMTLVRQVFSSNVANTNWALTASLLAAAVSLPITGRYGDSRGKKKVFQLLLLSGILGSVLATFSSSLAVLIVSRIFQGISLGTVSLGMSILQDGEDTGHRTRSIAIVGSGFGLGGAVALPLAALLNQNNNWRGVFWISAILLIMSTYLSIESIPNRVPAATGRFDVLGSITLAIGLIGFILAISKIVLDDWPKSLVYGVLLTSSLLLVFWGFYEKKITSPVVNTKEFVKPALLLTNCGSFFSSMSAFTFSVVVPQFLLSSVSTGAGLGTSYVTVGLCMMPVGLLMLVLSPIVAQITHKYGANISFLYGTLVFALAFAFAVVAPLELWFFLVLAILLGIGSALSYSSMSILAMRLVAPQQSGEAAGVNGVIQTLGAAIGSTIVAGVLTASIELGKDTPSIEAYRLCFLISFISAVLACLCVYKVDLTGNLRNSNSSK
jgi:MFS family permease